MLNQNPNLHMGCERNQKPCMCAAIDPTGIDYYPVSLFMHAIVYSYNIPLS